MEVRDAKVVLSHRRSLHEQCGNARSRGLEHSVALKAYFPARRIRVPTHKLVVPLHGRQMSCMLRTLRAPQLMVQRTPLHHRVAGDARAPRTSMTGSTNTGQHHDIEVRPECAAGLSRLPCADNVFGFGHVPWHCVSRSTRQSLAHSGRGHVKSRAQLKDNIHCPQANLIRAWVQP